jgi:hypothetical protein
MAIVELYSHLAANENHNKKDSLNGRTNMNTADCSLLKNSSVVKLNIGGVHFTIARSTVMKKIAKPNGGFYEPHLLQMLFDCEIQATFDDNNEIFIERNPKYFGYIVEYLRNLGTNKTLELHGMSQYDMNLFLNEAEYFKLKPLLNIHTLSSILNHVEFLRLNELCEFAATQNWKLLYRASADGFGADDFHGKCDDRKYTLTIIKSTNGNVFGGYADTAWSSFGEYKYSANSFLFSLVNNQSEPVKLACFNARESILCRKETGPVFGHSDIFISDKSDMNKNSYSKLGNSYMVPQGFVRRTPQSRSFLAGSSQFQVQEIEVFQKQI